MEITYKRELKHNYLIIVPEAAFYDSYEIRMMASNCIDGLLKFYVKQVDDRKSYYYEITSKQPLARILEYRSLGAEELYSLIAGIVQTLERMETYLLQEGQILLEPDFIYVEPECFTVSLCLVPGRQGILPEEMTALLQYLLGKVNHQDKECVVMAYGLYQESLKQNCGLDDLLRLTGRDGAADKSPVAEEADNSEEKQRRTDAIETEKEHSLPEERHSLLNHNREKEEASIKESPLLRNLSVFCAVLFGGPALCLLLYGENGVREYWIFLIAADGLTAIFLAARTVILTLSQKNREDRRFSTVQAGRPFTESVEKREYEEGSRHEWQMIFQEESEEETETGADIKRKTEADIKRKTEATARSEDCSTVLLTEPEPPSNSRCLRSIEAGAADIVIAYVPFIIGKQEGLADHVLSCDAVSRLHARIDREGETYRITDLNSTNGTRVGGRLLETNEMAVLSPGDEVYIANIGFIFT